MTIEYDPALRAYMEQKGRTTIAVEVVSSQHSDIEITELYVHLVTDRQAAYLKNKRRFRAVVTEAGQVLLPPYRLEYDDTVTFCLHKFWVFRSVRQTGIRL